jgi:hypothetical protein
MQNISFDGESLVDEDPWKQEYPSKIIEQRFLDPNYDPLNDPDLDLRYMFADGFLESSFTSTQVNFQSRIHPPMRARPTSPPFETDRLPSLQAQWFEQLARRRFCWAVLHRLRDPVGPPEIPAPPTSAAEAAHVTEAANAIGKTRVFDVYYVTLRRPNPMNRYARQDTASTGVLPDPDDLSATPAIPAALPADEDVMFPVPWRVQVQFLLDGLKSSTATDPGLQPTGIPTEIELPPADFGGGVDTAVMLVQMFPTGTKFIDEITGAVYRVVKQRVAGDLGERSYLTLDREVTMEDLDLPEDDPRCGGCEVVDPSNPFPDDEELIRTVWVFPPPVDRTQSGAVPVIAGKTPVVDIDVRTLSLTPSP